jgi:predicted Zn finger-like uncharacterized protein
MRIIQCEQCGKRFKINDDSGDKSNAKYKCSQCNHVIIVSKPVSTKTVEPSRDAAPSQPSRKPFEEKSILPVEEQTADDNASVNQETTSSTAGSAFGLKTKFNLAIGAVFLCAIVLIYFLSGSRLQKDAEQQVFDKARLLLITMESSRSFTSKVLKPVLYDALPDRFIIEGMSSSFGARNIFERIRAVYPQYYFKHAAPYPRNLINQADDFEMNIIQEFSKDPDLKEWQGYRIKGSEKEYSIMKPIVAEQACMLCHSDPALAPQELLERYGNENGFHRSVGEVIGTLTVSVPASIVMDKARENTMIFIGMVALFFVLLTLIVNVFFSRVVLKPIKHLADNANEISLGKLDTQIDTAGGDEIAMLAKAFNRMKISIKMAFEQLAK